MKKKELLKRIEALEAIVKPIDDLQKASEKAKGLEEKKELEVGKWYFGELDNERKILFCFSGEYGQFTQYGFNAIREWCVELGIYENDKYTEATPEEVQKALNKEAIKHGHKYDVYSWNHEQNTLYGNRGNDVGHDILFENGVWSEVKEFDKFAELKEAHKNGAVIQFKNSNTDNEWINCKDNYPNWCDWNEYRIKPEEEPLKVGDVCKFWNNYEEEDFEISILSEIHCNRAFPYTTKQGFIYNNAKKLTKEEAIELLFNN